MVEAGPKRTFLCLGDNGQPGDDEERVWERGWKGHEVAQLQRLARLTFAEKLRWLEEAARLVEQIAATPRATVAKAPHRGGDAG